MDDTKVYYIQIVFVCGVAIGTQVIDFDNKYEWLVRIARYVFYTQLISGTKELSILGYKMAHNVAYKKFDMSKTAIDAKEHLALFFGSTVLLIYYKRDIISEDFIVFAAVYLIFEYLKNKSKATIITYGTGMACSFFEGYLKHVIPSDGHTLLGFYENVHKYEQKHGDGVIFPVKKLFVVVTKSLYCPPDLKMFNKQNRPDLPSLEACQVSLKKSLEAVAKDVAGVKNRQYSNSVYRILRPGRRTLFLSVECASPLHTLYGVLNNRELYRELSNINKDEVVEDFCSTLRSILQGSAMCRDMCELVYYNDEDPTQNLADVLINKIRELNPNFEDFQKEQ